MALVKVVTRKEVDWHGRMEEFSNVYYFGDGDALNPGIGEVETLINKVIAQEKTICGSAVKFLGGLGYVGWNTIGDTPALATVELVGANNPGLGPTSNIYRELAVDIKFLLGGKRYLRTLMHTSASHGFDPNGVTPATPSASLQTFASNMQGSTHYAPFRRMAPNGDTPGGYLINPYLEHRQFHRYRRRFD